MSKLLRFQSEEAVVERLIFFLTQFGLQCKQEVPSMGQSIDLVAMDSSRVIAVEAKLSNWKGAIKQCEPHRLVADYVLIAMPERSISSDLKSAARLKGVGVLLFDYNRNTFRLVVKPKKSKDVWVPQRKVLLLRFEQVKNAD